MCLDGQWHCQEEFRAISWSPHKRRDDVATWHKYRHPDGTQKYGWLDRPCEHGIAKSKDYLMVQNRYRPIPIRTVEPPKVAQQSIFA